MLCEWESCASEATHLVRIHFPAEPPEVWSVCRAHDRMLKNLAVERCTPDSLQPASTVHRTAYCAACGSAYIDASIESCPHCDAVDKVIGLEVTDTAGVRENVRLRTKRSGKGGWLKDLKSGDDYTRALGTWGKRELETDREHKQYRELITLHDGTTIESTAALGNHRD